MSSNLVPRQIEVARLGGLVHVPVGIVSVAFFIESSIPAGLVYAFGGTQAVLGLVMFASFVVGRRGLVVEADRLDSGYRIANSISFGVLPWLSRSAPGETPTKYVLLMAMMGVVAVHPIIAAQFPERRRLFYAAGAVLGASYGLAFAQASEWTLAAFTFLWLFASLFIGYVTTNLQLNFIRLRNESQRLAEYDSLTGALSRLGFLAHLEAVRHGEIERSIGLIDLDDFKRVNDKFGHRAGDAVLCAVVSRIESHLADDAVVGRLGGDEFAVLVPGTAESSQVLALMETVVNEAKTPVSFEGRELSVGASIGVATLDPEFEVVDALIEADHAMYEAKALGGAEVVVFSEPIRQQMLLRLEIEAALSEGVENGEIRFWGQPIVDSERGVPVSVELLARWFRRDGSSVGPGEFLPVADRLGLLPQIGSLAISAAGTILRRWSDDAELAEVGVNINLSAKYLGPEVRQEVARAVSVLPNPELFTLEVIEDQLFSDMDFAAQELQSLRDLGVTLSIDDFGVGYSSLSYLRVLPMKQLKIDMSFVGGIDHDPVQQSLVRAMVDMACALDMMVVAEGVQTAAELSTVSAIGVHAIQGNFIAEPLELADCEQNLRRLCRLGRTDNTSGTVQNLLNRLDWALGHLDAIDELEPTAGSDGLL